VRKAGITLEGITEGVALLWVLFAAGAYLLLAACPLNPRTDAGPSPLRSLDAHALALLACVLLAGIINRFRGPGGADSPAPAPDAPPGGLAAEAVREDR
jgi:hypothetical protein